MDRETWASYSQKEREDILTDLLYQLAELNDGKHKLYGTPQQGGISLLKKELKGKISNIIQWESESD